MQIELTEQHAAVAQSAVAAGQADTPQQFVDGLIARYAEEEKRRAEVDAILRAGLFGESERFDSIDDLRQSLMAELEQSLEVQPV